MLRVMLVDDEPPARRGLRHLMRAHADAEIIGEAGNVEQARQMALALHPDALFLDVELADGLGFEVIEQLSPPPAVVFVTAHDLYALKAFDVAALDFLLKPVDPDRLAVTVDRLRRRQSALSPAEPRRRSNPIETNRLQEQRLHLRIDGQSVILPLGKIALLKAEEDFTRIFLGGEREYLVCRLLRHFEAQLPTPPFFRVGRSLIINLALLDTVEWLDGGRCSFSLGNDLAPISLGRGATQRLRRSLDSLGMIAG
jgi:two-component system LytT family response regulator